MFFKVSLATPSGFAELIARPLNEVRVSEVVDQGVRRRQFLFLRISNDKLTELRQCKLWLQSGVLGESVVSQFVYPKARRSLHYKLQRFQGVVPCNSARQLVVRPY